MDQAGEHLQKAIDELGRVKAKLLADPRASAAAINRLGRMVCELRAIDNRMAAMSFAQAG